ncbi:MAG: hypothetical protein FWC32_06635 [Firmicutes bacterium]|nr:hypothetical protein [Bacillota bacterium]
MENNFYPMTTAELMDRAIDVYKKTFGRQIGFAAIFGIISYLFLFFVGIIVAILVVSFSAFAANSPLNDTYSTFGLLTIIIAVVMPVILLYISVSSAGHILISKSAFYGNKENLPVGQLPRISLRIFGALIAQAIASLPFIGLIYLGFVTNFFTHLLARSPWEFLLLMLIFIVSYLIYMNLFSLSVAVAAFERKTFISALIRSWELIRGEFWKIAGIRLLWLLVIIAIWAAIYGAVVSVGIFAAFVPTIINTDASYAAVGPITVLSGLLSFAAMFAITPLDGVFQATLYYNQRIKKEGLDIEVKLEKLVNERQLL